jgi:hypothetical protein
MSAKESDKEKSDDQHPAEDEHLPPPAPKRERVGPQYHKNKAKLRRLIIYAAVLVIIAGAGGGYWYFNRHKTAKTAKTTQTQQSASSTKIDKNTQSYNSPNFYLGFNYPANWTVTDNGGGQMTITSPATHLKSTSGKEVTGQIILMLRSQGQALPEFNIGNTTAVLPSEKIAYTKPTQNQRANTYVSFLQYPSSSSGLDGIYITGDYGYQTGQAIPKVDIAKVDPVISVIFTQCTSSDCSSKATPLTISASSWSDPAFATPIKTMLESLSIT